MYNHYLGGYDMAKFYLHDITNIEPDSIDQEKFENIYNKMQGIGWAKAGNQRIGIVKSTKYKNMIGGYFANEGQKRAIWYNDEKEEIEPKPYFSFEHLFFVVFFDTMQILIQSRNIYDYSDLTLSLIRNNLLFHLRDIFRISGVFVPGRNIEIEDAGVSTTYEEMYATFTSLKNISEIEITNLYEATLPGREDPRYKLFNPREEWTEITWGAIGETLKKGLDSVKMTANDDPNATLKSPIPKAFAAAGNIERIKGNDAEDKIIIRQHTETYELEIELPADMNAAVDILERILQNLDNKGRVENWREKRKKKGFGNGQLVA
jgi:hypothetical protein